MGDTLTDEILMRYFVLVYINYVSNLQVKQILKFNDAMLGEFAPILKAAKLGRDRRYRYENNNNYREEDDDEDDAIVSSHLSMN